MASVDQLITSVPVERTPEGQALAGDPLREPDTSPPRSPPGHHLFVSDNVHDIPLKPQICILDPLTEDVR